MSKRSYQLALAGLATALALIWGGCKKASTGEGIATPAAKSVTTAKGISAAMGVSNRLAAITAAGEPVTLAELDQLYVTPPADQNAAPLYERAFDAFKNNDAESATFVADNIAALPLLVQAAERTECRYPVALTNGPSTLLPHLIKIKYAAKLLGKVEVNQAAKKRPDAATTTLLAGLSLAHSLDNEPIIISKMVELASIKVILDGLAQAFSLQPFSDDQLQNLQAALKTAETGTSLSRAVIGERVSLIYIFQLPDADLVKFGNALFGDSNTLDLVAYRQTELFQQDFTFMLDYMSNLVVLTDMPYSQSLDKLPAVVKQREAASTQELIFSKQLLLAFDNTLVRSANATAWIRAAQVAVAVERYRLQHANALPGTLADLVPEFLAEIPADPFDGQPLRFKRMPGKGYVVYSVGSDRKDDNGVEKAADGKTQFDLAFRVNR